MWLPSVPTTSRSIKEEFFNPYKAAEYGKFEDVIEPAESRRVIIRTLELFQNKQVVLPAKKTREYAGLTAARKGAWFNMAVGYGPLSGVTVVDLTQFLSGPLATMIMADLGADVIKVERPDRPKASGPFLNGERVYDLSVQRSKKSITLNLKAETDKKVLLELVKKADVLVENFKPGTMERMGLGYDIIAAANPRIIYMAVSGFGYTGPYRSRGALDMIVQGMSGSPILQDGKLAGAVTHVFVNDPTRGYGIFAENMLDAAR